MIGLDRPGFADPVLDAQSCFRAVLDAMARPGAIRAVGAGLAAPAPLDPATAAVLLTLVDVETVLWIDPAFDAAAPWITFHCGAGRTADLAAADFVLTGILPPLNWLRDGTDEAPESSGTLILQLPRLGAGAPWRLSGPGVATTVTLAADGLPQDFAPLWQANRARFPRGVDLLLCAGTRLAALPRGTLVAEG